jgi:hypothetical protein
MDDEIPSPTGESLPTRSRRVNALQEYSRRITLTDGIKLAIELLGCYPNAGKQPDSYLGAVAKVLMRYPSEISTQIRQLAEECKFLPTVADVVEWCEKKNPTPRPDYRQAIQQGRMADAELAAARLSRPTFAELQEKHGPGWGIRASKQDQIANEEKIRKAAEILDQANAKAIAEMDKAYGWDTAAKGYTPALARAMHEST